MSRYIDADAFEKRIEEERTYLLNRGQTWAENILVKHWLNILYEQPTVDAVEVVRCKDCKWLDTYTINGEDITACNNENAFFRDARCDEHCSCGERREDDGF